MDGQFVDQLLREQERATGFETLYRRHGKAVAALLYARGVNADTAQDITQEAFLRLWKQWEQGEAILNPRAWLLRVARNLAEDQAKSAFRRNGTQGPERMNDLVSEEPSPDESMMADERCAAVFSAFDRLPEGQRVAFDRHHLKGKRIAQIAEELERPAATIRRWLHEARRQLRRELHHLSPGAAEDDGAAAPD